MRFKLIGKNKRKKKEKLSLKADTFLYGFKPLIQNLEAKDTNLLLPKNLHPTMPIENRKTDQR